MIEKVSRLRTLADTVVRWFKSAGSSASAALTAQGAKVTHSPVASGTGIVQTVNSPTFNFSSPQPAPLSSSERYAEWRELIQELHDSLRVMANAFLPPGIVAVDEPHDYHEGIQRGYRVLRNRILIADVLKNACTIEKFRSIADYTLSARAPREPSQRGCPTMVGFNLKASEFEDELMELARKDSGLAATQTLPKSNIPLRAQPSTASITPNLEYAGCKEKRVFISPFARDGICDPRTTDEYDKSVQAFVLRFENRPLPNRKVARAMNVIAKVRFESENGVTERRINYGVWLNSPCVSTTMGVGDTCELVLMCAVDNELLTFEDRRTDGHSFHSDFSYIESGSVEGFRIVEITLIEKNTQVTIHRRFKVWREGSSFCLSETV